MASRFTRRFVCFSTLARRYVGPVLPAIVLCGCRATSPVPGSLPSTSPTAFAAPVRSPRQAAEASQASVAAVQSSTEYRQAVACYARKDYAGALIILDRLLAVPDRTPEQRAFLLRQREICRAAQTGGRADQRPALMNQGPTTTDQRRGHRAAEQADCGPRALLLVCRKLGVAATIEELRRRAGTTGFGTTLEGLAKAARAKGLKAEGVQTDLIALSALNCPSVAWVDGGHYVAVVSIDGDQATIHDPNKPDEEVMKTEELLRRSGGILLTLSHREGL